MKRVSLSLLFDRPNNRRQVTDEEFAVIKQWIRANVTKLGLSKKYSVITNGYRQIKHVFNDNGDDCIAELIELLSQSDEDIE